MWAKIIQGPLGDASYSIKTDQNDNIYYSGYFKNTIDFDPGAGVFNLTATSGNDLFVSKLDPNGNFLWAIQTIGGNGDESAQSIDLNSNNIYVTGYFEFSPDFDPGAGSYSLTSNGVSDAFILKLIDCVALSPTASVNSSVCSGSSLNFTASISGTVVPSYTWSGPNTYTSNVQNPVIAGAGTVNIGIYTLTINNGGCMETVTTQVNAVNPLPTVSVNNGTICSGNTFTITPSGASTYTIQGGNAVVSPTTSTSYTVKYFNFTNDHYQLHGNWN